MSDMSAKGTTNAAKSAAAAVASAVNNVASARHHRLPHAAIVPHRSATRGHTDHGWLNTYHSFSFADWYNPKYTHFGALRVLNEDRVQPQTGFPTHPHRDYEIFSYVLAGELTHRDSMVQKGREAEAGASADQFSRIRRGDVQFTTGGTGIAHSEFNEHATDPVHFLQIWARAAGAAGEFVPILSPLAAGAGATPEQEAAAAPTLPGTVPIHADFAMGATLLAARTGTATWTVGLGAAGAVTQAAARKVFVHLPMTTQNKPAAASSTDGGGARIRLNGRHDAVLNEGDGAFVDGVTAGDQLTVESIGGEGAEHCFGYGVVSDKRMKAQNES
ncbi:pirin domain containing protein [Niveomyces insectorum RCEF 264]|uniref:Pirin domain containing protein n=1 Tax=Niveomyces insectorum RCEF 264 TaxID=1081102 RepID=A0A167UL87_9HYPO|nr:pirin domain containing protein [Niveomyces insectorum RCEF 264]